MRVELENRFKTKKYTIKTKDNKTLDCILIYSNSEEVKKKLLEERAAEGGINVSDTSEMFSNEMTVTGPLMLFCNPNAGYYEYMYYEVKIILIENRLFKSFMFFLIKLFNFFDIDFKPFTTK